MFTTKRLLASITLAASLLAPATAQQSGQVVCFSFDGTSKLTGKDNTGARSRTGVRVGGKSFFVGGAGSSPADCATQLEADLKKAGYTAKKASPNVVCVSAGPGGTAITKGGIIGSTDTGLDGIDCSVHVPPPPPNKKPPKKTIKKQGCAMPMVKPNVRVKITQTIEIEVEIEKVVNGKKVKVTIKIKVTLQAGMSSQQANAAIRQAMQKAGICPAEVWRQSPFLNVPIPSFALEFDLQGNPVHHLVLWQPPQLDLFPMEISAGETAPFGGTTFGASSGNCRPGTHQGIYVLPQVGGRFQPFVQMGPPLGMAFPAIGFGQAEIPFLGGDLLIDPNSMLLLPPIPLDLGGHGQLPLPLPPNPSLSGLQLHSQFLVLDRGRNQQCLTNGLSTRIK